MTRAAKEEAANEIGILANQGFGARLILNPHATVPNTGLTFHGWTRRGGKDLSAIGQPVVLLWPNSDAFPAAPEGLVHTHGVYDYVGIGLCKSIVDCRNLSLHVQDFGQCRFACLKAQSGEFKSVRQSITGGPESIDAIAILAIAQERSLDVGQCSQNRGVIGCQAFVQQRLLPANHSAPAPAVENRKRKTRDERPKPAGGPYQVADAECLQSNATGYREARIKIGGRNADIGGRSCQLAFGAANIGSSLQKVRRQSSRQVRRPERYLRIPGHDRFGRPGLRT